MMSNSNVSIIYKRLQVCITVVLATFSCEIFLSPAVAEVNSNALMLSLVPARTTGVAPLSVFFDATATTDSGVTTRPFHDLEYRWRFSDASAGKWMNGAQAGESSKNVATGPIAAHVFEVPGTYIVHLDVFDGKLHTSNRTTITVQDPDVIFKGSNTICFSTSAIYSECPSGAKHVHTSNFTNAINDYQGSNRRLLFRRGETFIAGASGTINKTGPGIVGAYGKGDLPVIQGAGSSPILLLSSARTPGIKDWRIMDLDFDGQSVMQEENIGIDAAGGINQVLILRMKMRNMYRGASAGPWILDYLNMATPGHMVFDEWTIMDSTMSGIPGCNSPGNYKCNWRVYLSGKRHAIQGNMLDNEDTGGSHVIRSEYMDKGIINSNTIARAGIFQHAIKLHAWIWNVASVANPGGVGTYSEKIIIADNKIIGGANPWTISLGPQNESSDERVKDVIVERNWITAGAGTQIGIETSASETTIRNNLFDMSGAASQSGIYISRRGIEPVPDNVRVYNNTFYSATSGTYTGVKIDKATNVSIKNNLGYARLGMNPQMISGASSGGVIQQNNSTNVQFKNVVPGWVMTEPNSPVQFKLSANSYAWGTGSIVPVYSDFFLLNRSVNGLGATGR